MCLGGRPSTPAPTNVKDNSMYYNGNVFDPIPEEELETETSSMGAPIIPPSTPTPTNPSGLSIADANNGIIGNRDLAGN
tara:strand:+ start:6170 stop:6406 length:237 start_codon:yes stop_codon:yes gene_type:complete